MSEGTALLEHLERSLGTYAGKGFVEPEFAAADRRRAGARRQRRSVRRRTPRRAPRRRNGGSPAELRDSLDRLIVARPEHVDLADCEELEPPVGILWLLPFATDESHVALEHGWRDLLDWLRSSGADPYDLRRPSLV